MNHITLSRLASKTLNEHLRVMPAVVVSGTRQTGKSTLVKEFVPGERRFYTLEDFHILNTAQNDPEALVVGSDPVTLDEVQREPKLLLAVKSAIDRYRQPGQFLLTGSVNFSLMRNISESLAGRASYLALWPMTRREQMGLGRCGVWEELVGNDEKDWVDILSAEPDDHVDWCALARRGGFPVPSVHLSTDTERKIWFDGYIRTYLERDLQALSVVSSLPDFYRLVQAVCLRVGQLANQTEISRDVSIPQPTVHRYLNLLETSCLLVRLPAYSINRTKRLVKSPKFYWCDTGMALHIAGGVEPTGAHLENLVLQDMLAWRDTRHGNVHIHYWRTTKGEEVDFVIETGGRILPIEVKTTNRPHIGDSAKLRLFRKEYGSKARAGLLLHTGDDITWMTNDVLAIPWWRIF